MMGADKIARLCFYADKSARGVTCQIGDARSIVPGPRLLEECATRVT